MGLDKEDGRLITKRFVQITFALWVIWDIIAVVLWGGYATESAVIADWSEKLGTIPLVVGIVSGHFFWKIPAGQSAWKYRYYVLVAVAVVSMISDLIMYRVVGKAYPLWTVAVLPVVGYFIGHFFWPQHRRNS